MGLIEVALAIVIVGVGVVAMMQFLATATTTNGRLGEMTTGMALASSAMEYATDQDYATLEGWLTSAPAFPDTSHHQDYLAGATGAGLEQSGWKQTFAAERVRLANLQSTTGTTSDDVCIRVKVTVSRNGKAVYTATRWFTQPPAL